MNGLLKLIGVRRREAPVAFLMTLYFFLAMASVSILKSLQNALYLGFVGFDWRLPGLYIVLAIVSGLGVLLYRRLASRHSRLTINLITLAALIATLILFYFALSYQTSWVYMAFYIWGGIFSVLVPTQGWLLSYELYTTREAKRLFAVLGTGGILGGAGGGYYAYFAADWGAPEGILIQICFVLLIMQGVLLALRRRRSPAAPNPARGSASSDGFLKTILGSQYLSHLAAVVLLSAATTTIIDLLYKWVLEERFEGDPDQITRFFGSLLGTMFIISALVQLLGTSRILRAFGVGVALLVLPAAVATGSLALIVFAASFWPVVGLKILDGCLRSSLQKTSVEMLYIPISSERATIAKGGIDLVAFRIGDALGASLFLLVSSLLMAFPWLGGVAVLVAALLWFAATRRMAREYLDKLRRSLEVRVSPPPRKMFRLHEAGAGEALLEALRSERSAKVHFALQQLMRSLSNGGAPALESSEMVYPRFQPTGEPPWLSSVEPLLGHQNREVAAAALHLLVSHQPKKYWKKIRVDCQGAEVPELLCLHYLDRYVKNPGHHLRPERVLEWAHRASPPQAVVLASLMGKMKDPMLMPVLKGWVASLRRPLARQALVSVGRHRDPADVDFLIQHLALRWSRNAARRALIAHGETALPRLVEVLKNEEEDLGVRREIPPILAALGTPAAQEELVAALYIYDPVIAFRSLKSLNKIRTKADLRFGEDSFLPLLQIWAREHYELTNLNRLLGQCRESEERLLRKAVRERIGWGVEKIFRGLELFLPPGDAYFSYLGFTSDDKVLRENAIELIDIRIKGELRQTLIPIFTARNSKEMQQHGQRIFGLSSEYEKVFSDALFTADPWLKCCIIAAVRSKNSDALKARVEQSLEDFHPLVRETAQWALRTWAA